MLQIASGKLFSKEPARRNELRGVLFSNLLFFQEGTIATAAGRLLPTTMGSSRPRPLVYEFTECMEETRASGAIMSYQIEPYILDFAAVVSLGFNATCTVSADAAKRLTAGERSTKVTSPPSSFIPRVFDREIVVRAEDVEAFVEFVGDLIALERHYYLGAMRAIKTYVVAMQRLVDDLDLSYTLLVASIESLAQSFDRFEPEWTDYDEAKRVKIDKALAGACDQTGDRVRRALLEIEKSAVGKRFREFTKANIRGSFFREEADGNQHPVSRADLDQLLREAYALRSGYIHRLLELPRALTIAELPGEAMRVDGRMQFTFRGLARLARHVILGFVRRGPKLEREPYDYRTERHGVVELPVAPHYWVGDTRGVTLASGVKRLEAFLTQLSSCFSNEPDAVITDLQPVLTKVEPLMASGTELARRPFLALYRLFNGLVSDDRRMPNVAEIEHRFRDELDKPCLENMLVYLIQRVSPDWRPSDYERILDDYFEQRTKRNGLRLPRAFEAGMMLHAAEQSRLDGDIGTARTLVSRATECHPGHQPLRQIEERVGSNTPIDWFEVVFPERSNRKGNSDSEPDTT